MPKFEGKNGFPGRRVCKKVENFRVFFVKLTGNLEGEQFQFLNKNRYPQLVCCQQLFFME